MIALTDHTFNWTTPKSRDEKQSIAASNCDGGICTACKLMCAVLPMSFKIEREIFYRVDFLEGTVMNFAAQNYDDVSCGARQKKCLSELLSFD